MPVDDGEQISRSSLYALLVQVDRKLAVVENRVANIEMRMVDQLGGLEKQMASLDSRSTITLYGLVVFLVISGITLMTLLLGGYI